MPCAHCTMSVVLRYTAWLVPTRTVNWPGSTAHVFRTVHTASWLFWTGIVTVFEPPALQGVAWLAWWSR